jgi:hypothetical protein
MPKNLLESAPLSGDLTGKVWRIRIIEGDRQGSSAYYPKEALREGAPLFKKGTRMFRNHPSESDQWNQPERKVEDIVGWFTEDATYDGKDLYTSAQFLESEQERIKELAEAGVIAVSIRAAGELTEGANGPELARFTHVYSVDVVTQAGAGGAFTEVLESDRNSEQPAEPEGLAESQQEEEEMDLPKEFLEALDGLSNSMNALIERLDKKDEAPAPVVESGKDENKLSLADLDAKLNEAELSASGRKAVIEAVEAGKDVQEAIDAEKAREDEIRESLKGDFQANVVTESGKDEGFKFGSIFG